MQGDKTKESSFAVFQENETYLSNKFLYRLLLTVIRHVHAKLAQLDFIDKGIIGKRGKPNIPSDKKKEEG